MTIRPLLAPPAQPKEQRPRQIRPMRVWTTLTPAQQTAVFQEVVTMCQECLLTAEEASHDAHSPLAENYVHPS
ncbi:hypothetical protein KSZ_51720 [Dictyobacter formicarum]|uniref:Uncharacterized protein n=1 Tax=Dictyobacter formicarum TaxID=2778368 RepID=A0ABQ3VPY4_9CHLR|nr:hypothetical protein KSZ_51720 [Dictyobacter formicarum]